jgi:acyl-CoA synthetase (AMP-forming)/AMP-acid ligase II
MMDAHAHASLRDELIARYRPDFVLTARGDQVEVVRHDARGERPLHGELSVLLSTSGTTGSPKLVRLSHANVLANARSIAEYLELGPNERAISSLPFHYSYGLSVLNSHLFAGGSIVVSDASVMRPELWKSCSEYGCTSFAGVPYSYQILRRIGFEKFELPTLRTLTQAGGKLARPLIEHYHRLISERGGRFIVMYGQTEATARMSYVPPERALEKAGSIGIAIPGGSLRVFAEERELPEPLATGELVYEGPNVMLGYASSPEELALGDTQRGRLRTGDLGYRDADGFFHITGRLKRFAKVYGLRINLDEVEERARRHGPAAVVSDDERLMIYCEFGDPALFESVRGELAQIFQLNVNTFSLTRVDALPLLASGKIDYDALKRRSS